MTGLYEQVLKIPGGGRAIASARLRQSVLVALRLALRESGLSQAELARRLRVRKSAVNRVFQGDGNVRINTLAEYLHELDAEIRFDVLPAGTQRCQVEADMRLRQDRSRPVAPHEEIRVLAASAPATTGWRVPRVVVAA